MRNATLELPGVTPALNQILKIVVCGVVVWRLEVENLRRAVVLEGLITFLLLSS